jgi:DMSO/TMAO reductase YedYZ molybdopterin-dependent catalytic subunit
VCKEKSETRVYYGNIMHASIGPLDLASALEVCAQEISMPIQPRLPRRQFLAASAGVFGALTTGTLTAGAQDAKVPDVKAPDVKIPEVKGLPPYVSWKKADAVIVHSPETIEMKRGYGGTSVITPSDALYIRNNVPAPDAAILADRDGWKLSIEGVANPKALTVGDLKALGVESVATVLQCSGNGRAFFDHKPSGTKWTVGAAGCVLWSGVPVRVVVEALGGVVANAKFMTSTGGETLPNGLDPKTLIVERSVPTAAMQDALLAWEMNGEPLSLAHGGPLRIVIPGYHGVNNIKYIKRLAFADVETDAKIHKTGYRVHAVDAKSAADQPSMWEMPVKSWVTSPLKDAKTGRVQITGVAFGGINAVNAVEVSVDGGKNWAAARFVGPDLGRYAWRQFVLAADLKPGAYRLVCRAVDDKGTIQPEEFATNGSGYGHNGWRAHGVDVTVV